jgi:hypothetical protein
LNDVIPPSILIVEDESVVAVQPVLILEETPSPKESSKDLAQADKSVPTDPLLIKEPKEPKI